jgi:predicted ATPase
MMFQCIPGGARTTLHPLLRALPQAEGASRRQVSAEAVSQLFRDAGIDDQEVIAVFAFLLGAEGGGDELEGAGPDAVREKSVRAAQRCLAELCATGPLLLVVEDVHWIDPTSRHLLASALQVIASLPVLVLLTSRPEAGGHWQDLPNTRIMPLGPLGGPDARNVIIAKFPRQDELQGGAMLDLIEKVSGGVPLYIEEICQWASENLPSAREALTRSDSSNRLSAFETVVTARLAMLGAAAEVAGAAAAFGIRFGTQLLKAVLPALPADVVDAAIAELLKQGFVVQVSLAEPALYAFRHALVRETIYKSLLRAERQGLHGRIYAIVHGDRAAAPWIDSAALAEQAEGAGLLAEAVECLLAAGGGAAARSAMAEARQLLEHALALCRSMEDEDWRERLMLRTTALLGPVLTTSEGPGSEPAQRLYEEGIAIARRRPPAERATWFPVYWGWWFTGSDVNGARAHALLEEMRDVDNAEVQLQSRHCVWAIDFYLGRHGMCVTSVDEGLPLYELHPELRNPSHYGGHDTKVCGLAHRGLALWFEGRAADAVASLGEAKTWAAQTGHPGSMAHAAINSAMLAAYRRDFPQLRREIAGLRVLTGKNRMPTLEATAGILEGWCQGVEGDAAAGRDLMRRGLDVHRQLQTPEDYPVYCTLLAELLVLTGESKEALRLLDAIADEQAASGHVFWLAELHRRRAQVMALENAAPPDVEELLAASLEIATAQGAVPLLLRAYDTLLAFAPHSELVARYRASAGAARHLAADGMPLFGAAEAIVFPDRKA